MPQEGRDREETTAGRRNDMTSGQGNTARRTQGTGTAGGRAGVDTESVDFDATGDLDRGHDDAEDAERSTGPGPGYGMENAGMAAGGDASAFDAANVVTDSSDLSSTRTEAGPGAGTSSAMRVSDVEGAGNADITGGMGSGVGDEQGFGQGADMDPQTIRGDAASTGTNQRAGLGGRSSGQEMDPGSGAPFANPADMGEQS